MKTTVDIPNLLLDEARKVAARDHTTGTPLIERGLRSVRSERTSADQFRLRKATFRGEGLQPGVVDATWERIGDFMYVDHRR